MEILIIGGIAGLGYLVAHCFMVILASLAGMCDLDKVDDFVTNIATLIIGSVGLFYSIKGIQYLVAYL